MNGKKCYTQKLTVNYCSNVPEFGIKPNAIDIVMHLLDKLKSFEQKEHFSLKEQNGLERHLAYVRKRPACQGDRTQDLQVGSQVL